MLRLVFPQWRRTERALSSPQEVPLAQPGCELGAGRRSNDAADRKVDRKVRAPRFAPAFTDRIQRDLVHPEKLSPWLRHPHILLLEHDRPVATALAVHQTVPLAANARGVVWPAVRAGQRRPDGRR